MIKDIRKKTKILDWSNDPDVQKELSSYEKYIEESKKQIYKKILWNSIGCMKIKQPIDRCCKKINLSKFPNFNTETIGQLLGRKGQYKQIFVNTTGVDMELDKEEKPTSTIVISKYNAEKVNKACKLIEKLMALGKWNPEKMQSIYDEVCKEWEVECIAAGKKTLSEFLKYEEPISEELARHVGALEYVYSFNQNILEHSMEVAQICADIAIQMELDPVKAKRAGFFHDIGKAIANFEDHVEKGIAIAKRVGLEEYIINAIESHHGKVSANTYYAKIVKVADKISAGREGARPRQNELIDQRKKMIESKLLVIPWIEKVQTQNAGNYIHIFIKLSEFHGDRLNAMKAEVQFALREINAEYTYNFEIKFSLEYEDKFFLEDE
ncbi:HD domain-containing protein [Candidatus Mycoplasma haematohominis]|uniref:Ribonuclease Y n=1 Tax=Candidatus Mycoplasma haematohominis TaxID=1494318 RepID=A0A478FT74_9MOLU|nr:HD domain-containing protein [Candidatus Mycoplasma haemohominis]GCE63295.1 ribonuclease Y [Candidatus Mycoplasma haemohominis]